MHCYSRELQDNVMFLLLAFLALEAGINQAGAIKELGLAHGWGRCEIVKDLAGIDRVVILWKQK